MKERKKRAPEPGTPVMVRMQASQLRWLDGDRAMRGNELSRPEAVRMILDEWKRTMSEYDSFIREFHRHKIKIDGALSDPSFPTPAQFPDPVDAISWIIKNGLSAHRMRFEVQMSEDTNDVMTIEHEVLQNVIKHAPR